jgi:hypothetical protein
LVTILFASPVVAEINEELLTPEQSTAWFESLPETIEVSEVVSYLSKIRNAVIAGGQECPNLSNICADCFRLLLEKNLSFDQKAFNLIYEEILNFEETGISRLSFLAKNTANVPN